MKGREWWLFKIKGSWIFIIVRERLMLFEGLKSARRHQQPSRAQARTVQDDCQDAALRASEKAAQPL